MFPGPPGKSLHQPFCRRCPWTQESQSLRNGISNGHGHLVPTVASKENHTHMGACNCVWTSWAGEEPWFALPLGWADCPPQPWMWISLNVSQPDAPMRLRNQVSLCPLLPEVRLQTQIPHEALSKFLFTQVGWKRECVFTWRHREKEVWDFLQPPGHCVWLWFYVNCASPTLLPESRLGEQEVTNPHIRIKLLWPRKGPSCNSLVVHPPRILPIVREEVRSWQGSSQTSSQGGCSFSQRIPGLSLRVTPDETSFHWAFLYPVIRTG